MRLDIQFFDKGGQPTDDCVQGLPMVKVGVSLGIEAPANATSEEIEFELAEEWALVDTGASHTVVLPSMVEGKTAIHNTSLQSATGAVSSNTYASLLVISPFNKPHFILVGKSELGNVRMLLGRDVLSEYKLVFSKPTGEFYLED